MTLISLILALLIEQFRPRGRFALSSAWAARVSRLQRRLPAGGLASGGVILLTALISALLHLLLWHLHPLLAFVFNVLVLYLTMGFRCDLHAFTAIQVALRIGELTRAQTLLAGWRGGGRPDALATADATEVARLAIEQALVRAHRNVFGIVFWFVILPGPSGAVLYRLACAQAERSQGLEPDNRLMGRAFEFLDALPARLTALSFSVVGNFEDAIYCWRTQAVLWPDRSSGILIASGGGALGVRLGMPIHESGEIRGRPEMGAESEADADYMQSTVGLVWRALMVCLLLLAVGSIAGWVGG